MDSAFTTVEPSALDSSQRRRLWPLAVILIAHYAIVQTAIAIDLTQFQRFVTRLASTFVVLLVFLVWWLRSSRFRWPDKLLVIGLMIAGVAVADVAGDPTISIFGLLLDVVPIALALGLATLHFLGSRPMSVQRGAFAMVVGTVFGVACLIRWEGVDSRQQGSYSWRWTPTAEQSFLARRHEQDSSDENPRESRIVALQPGDWVGFRGGDKDGAALSPELADWRSNPPRPLWKRRVGPSWSSVSIVDGLVITQEQRADDECIVAYDAATGNEIWVHADKARFDEPLSGVGPRGTPAFCAGRVYTSGARGRVNCLNAADGSVVWTKGLLAETGAKAPNFGASTSPLIVDQMVVAFSGGTEGRGLLAFDAATGREIWRTEAGTETFSTPHLATLHGMRQVLMHDNSGLFAVRVEDGKRLWLQPAESELAIPMLQPHVLPDGDIIVDWNDNVARLGVIRDGDSWSVTETWRSHGIKPGYTEYVVHDGHLYGLDDGIMVCLDAATGERKWKKGRYKAGQLLLLPEQSKILVLGETGDVYLVAANPAKHEELGRFAAIQGKTWQNPVLAHGRLYVRNAEEMACFELATNDKQSAADEERQAGLKPGLP
jgi:outer membrane protein assembly factor BamB